MEFDKKTSKTFVHHTLNLYKVPPMGRFTLEECEDLFRQRLEALTIIENTADLGPGKPSNHAKELRDIKSHAFKTNCIVLKVNDAEQRRLDSLSHMLTRMYCIYNSSLWPWFKSCERKLLLFRLRDLEASLSGDHLEGILRSFNFNFERVTGTELVELHKENLIGWSQWNGERDIADIFKVKFIHALRFIAKRQVSLKDGYAFLTRQEIILVVCEVFDRHLDTELNYARQHLNVEVLQTQQLLESLSMVYLDFQEKILDEKRMARRDQEGDNQNPYRINIDNIEDLKNNHYPPCMRYIHESLLEDHHLRHTGRLHYGAFLRSGGVDMESAIEFWRKEFTKKIPNDKFERDYKYNIRHLYGREGHKKSLSCFSCDKIINDNPPGPADKHGCPFRHFDDKNLRTMLSKHGLKEADIESLVLEKNNKDYKNACSHYFKFLKGEFPTEPIKNPIHFYYESMRLANRPPPPNEDESMIEQGESADQTKMEVKTEEEEWEPME